MCITNLDIVFGQILNIENLLKNNILMCVLTYLPHKGLLFLEIKISQPSFKKHLQCDFPKLHLIQKIFRALC